MNNPIMVVWTDNGTVRAKLFSDLKSAMQMRDVVLPPEDLKIVDARMIWNQNEWVDSPTLGELGEHRNRT